MYIFIRLHKQMHSARFYLHLHTYIYIHPRIHISSTHFNLHIHTYIYIHPHIHIHSAYLNLWVYFAEYNLFYRALFQKRPIIMYSSTCTYACAYVPREALCTHTHTHAHAHTHTHTHTHTRESLKELDTEAKARRKK